MVITDCSIDEIVFNPKTLESLIFQLRKAANINFECYKREFLIRRIKARMYRLNMISDDDYLDYISRNSDEFKEFCDLFTINYTYFFRNYEIFKHLSNNIAKIKRRNKHKLMIWSCPCATGEEPYSIAMLFDTLRNVNPNIPDVEIVASDIDRRVLDFARDGVYGAYSVHDLPETYMKSYFTTKTTRIGPQYTISEKIKDKVRFLEEDLTNGHSLSQKYDVVFCRNFLIYLNKKSQRRVLKTIADHLNPGGLMIIGKTEMVLNSKSSLFRLTDARYHFYEKR